MADEQTPNTPDSFNQPRNVFCVDREIWDHSLFASEPYTEREAWLWLVGSAAWKPMKIRWRGQLVQLERGQLMFSVRFLAQKWGWSKSRVHRFLDLLKSETMVGQSAGHGINLLTICNYDRYQLTPGYQRDSGDAKSGTAGGHSRDKEESYNHTISNHIVEAPPAAPPENVSRETKRKGTSDGSRGTRLPEGWLPSSDVHLFAIGLLGEAGTAFELDKFRDYWLSRAGAAARKTDWDRTFRNWCRTAKERRPNGGNGSRPMTLKERTANALQQLGSPAPRQNPDIGIPKLVTGGTGILHSPSGGGSNGVRATDGSEGLRGIRDTGGSAPFLADRRRDSEMDGG